MDPRRLFFTLRHGLRLFVDTEANSQWIKDSDGYNRPVFWGPIDEDTLTKLNLLVVLGERIRKELTRKNEPYDALEDLCNLATLSKPFVECVFELVPLIGKPRPDDLHNGNDRLARILRDRRLELGAMGFAEETRAALEILTLHDPALPDEGEFKTVATDANPADAPRVGWGPENEGLRAAPLMPGELIEGKEAEVRLFIENVSDRPIFMTVSERAGYDYPSAMDADGGELKVQRPMATPMSFSTQHEQSESDPGVATTSIARLKKLKLQPGAIWELKTKTVLLFYRPGTAHNISQAHLRQSEAAQRSIAVIETAADQAVITYLLRTANGAEYSPNLHRRWWPAKGGWSGLLETAPTNIKLSAARASVPADPVGR